MGVDTTGSVDQVAVIKSDQFHGELLALVKRYDMHAGWFVWAMEKPSDGDIQGTAAIMAHGCSSCTASILAIGIATLDEDMREAFSHTLQHAHELGSEGFSERSPADISQDN